MTGFLCLYKKAGISSFGAIARIRRITGEKKLGHSGTLDPMATGVLPVAFGRAAKFIELLPDNNKAYTAEFKLGIKTDTLDITGNILSQSDVSVGEKQVTEAVNSFIGEQMQLPPMYSAISKNGVRLYDLARRGIETEREERKINIYSIDYLGAAEVNVYKIYVKCGKGTYIRSLVNDIGEKLGCGAVLTALERDESNGFFIENAVTEEQVEEAVKNGNFEKMLIPVDEMLKSYPPLYISGAQYKRFKNGGSLDLSRLNNLQDGILHRVYAPNGNFIAIGEKDINENILKMKKLFEI